MANQPHVLIVCPTSRDKRELSLKPFIENYHIHFQEYDSSIIENILCNVSTIKTIVQPQLMIDSLVKYCNDNSINAVVSTEDYPGCLIAAAVCEQRLLPGPLPQSLMLCQHKYYSRVKQQQIVPQATPKFCIIDPHHFDADAFTMDFPLFLKPVKSNFSIFANKIENRQELESAIKTCVPSQAFLQQFNWFMKKYTLFDIKSDHLLAENLLQGEQVTVEGYVYQGEVHILGVVDSIMFKDTICFERFDYPSALPSCVQAQMTEIATQFIQGIGLDNLLFNIEMIYNAYTQNIHIIEVNSRMSSQFADLFEKVDGFNTYQILIDIGLGIQPIIPQNQGKYKTASSFVLRRFDNGRVIKMPTTNHINALYENFPDARVELFTIQGEMLDKFKQDGKSYRYGLIHLGAQDKEQLFKHYQDCQRYLPFEFD